MLQTTAEIIDRRPIGVAQETTLAAPELARALAPGQAVLVKCGWGLEPYLRRTFHPVASDAETWTLEVPDRHGISVRYRAAWTVSRMPCSGIVTQLGRLLSS